MKVGANLPHQVPLEEIYLLEGVQKIVRTINNNNNNNIGTEVSLLLHFKVEYEI